MERKWLISKKRKEYKFEFEVLVSEVKLSAKEVIVYKNIKKERKGLKGVQWSAQKSTNKIQTRIEKRKVTLVKKGAQMKGNKKRSATEGKTEIA